MPRLNPAGKVLSKMRWILPVVLLAFAAPAQAQQNDAEKLFRGFDNKLAAAKAYKVDFDSSFSEKSKTVRFKGDLTVAAGNKLRTSFSATEGVKPHSVAIVSSGAQLAVTLSADGKSETKTSTVSEKMGEQLTGFLTRVGVFFGVKKVTVIPAKAGSTPAALKMTGFKLTGMEKLNGRETQIIGFTLEVPDEKGKPVCRLWLDTKTQLPLKRTFEINEPGITVRVVELYSNWQIDPQLDAKLFELPK